MPDPQQAARFEQQQGFIAALDQSGGSTPKALRAYGIEDSAYASDAEMFDLIHQARTRIITSPVFTGERVLGAILFEGTLDRQIEGKDPATYLWEVKGIVPFLKIDKGLEAENNGVQLMKEIPGLDALLARARAKGVFGTKERSVIKAADAQGIADIAQQQIDLGTRVLAADLVPILEPEVDINTPNKAQAEEMLKSELLRLLPSYGSAKVGVKLTIPDVDGFYADLIGHPNVARVVALSGGYSRDDANERLKRNPALIASFSRALLDGLTAGQDDESFDKTLDASIESIYRASIA